jgi:hypothetical protein
MKVETPRQLLDFCPKIVFEDGTTNGGPVLSMLETIWGREFRELGPRTLEIGAGVTTLALLIRGVDVDSVDPDPRVWSKIYGLARELELPGLRRLRPICLPSHLALPALRGPYGFALMDGDSAFPEAALEWGYVDQALREGGLLMLDDVKFWTNRQLALFLEASEHYELERDLGRARLYRKLEHGLSAMYHARQPRLVVDPAKGG